MRTIESLNSGWTFVKTAENALAAAQAAGEAVTLPHTWNAQDGQDGGNDYYRGTCWYVRPLAVALEAGQEAWLEFLGAAMTADVYVDGAQVAHHEGGYATFRVNVTHAVCDGAEHVLAVAVNNEANDTVYPQYADFTFYGGLYRDVNLLVVPATHFALGYHGAPAFSVTPQVTLATSDAPATAEVTVEAWVEGAQPDAPQTVTFDVADQTVCAPVVDGKASAVVTLNPVHLWDGVDDPYLYTAVATLSSGDEVSLRFGCRTFAMDPHQGFILNGRSYPLRGVSRHQDRAGVGNALTPAMHAEDMALIREMGANTIRLAHYQHAQEFYDLCDEYGICVWAEIPYISLSMPSARANTVAQMRELVLQNYNHPSIVCWGLSNEITTASPVNDELLDNHRELNDLVHALDHTRPTTMANVFMLPTDSPLLEIPDINSYNLYYGWYVGALEDTDDFFDRYHQTYPDRVIGFSEYGADANPRLHSSDPVNGDYSEEYQCIYHEHMLKMIEERPWLWATHVWNMFDFAADGRDEGGEHGVNQKGLVTMDRTIKKDAFYLYKAHWSHEPFVHVCGHRYVNRAEDVTTIKVYSNQPEVSLYQDGELVGTQTGAHCFVFEAPITGEHTFEARAGELADSITVKHVDEPDPSYCLGDAKAQEGVANWFEDEVIDPAYYSVRDTFGDLKKSPQVAALLDKMMASGAAARGDVAKVAMENPELQRIINRQTLESMLQRMDTVEPEQIKELNAMLQKFPKVQE